MSTGLVTVEDYKFFDLLAPYFYSDKTPEQVALLREQVEYGIFQIETLLENTLAKVGGRYVRVAEEGRDFDDGSDSKKSVSCFRNNSYSRDQWTNSFIIRNTKNKTGLLRCVCYSRQQDKFYFYAIPYSAYKGIKYLEFILDRSTGFREPKGIPCGKWASYLVDSFEELATITETEAERLPARCLQRALDKYIGTSVRINIVDDQEILT